MDQQTVDQETLDRKVLEQGHVERFNAANHQNRTDLDSGPGVASDVGFQRTLIRYAMVAAVAVASIVIWWGVRNEETSRAETVTQQHVDAEILLIAEQLEASNEVLETAERLIGAEGLEPEAVTELLTDLRAGRREAGGASDLLMLTPAASSANELAFSSGSRASTLLGAEKIVAHAQQSIADQAELAAPATSSSGRALAVVARPLQQRTRTGEQAVLVALTPLGSDTVAMPIDFVFRVEGVEPADYEIAQEPPDGELSETELVVGSHRWLLQPRATSASKSHVGSDFLWAAGVIITALTLFFKRPPRAERLKENNNLLHSYYRLTDSATGFLNSEGVSQELEIRVRKRRRSGQVGVLLCGIDRFESIKQSFSPEIVDDLVRTVFVRVHALLKGNDSCGRLGESQLLIMSNSLPTTRDLEMLAEKIAVEFADPVELSDGTICHVSFSVGVAALRSPELSASDLLTNVALAQGQAAQRGGGAYVRFSAEQLQQAVVDRQLERELLEAVQSDELSVHYQAVVEVCGDLTEQPTVNKVEALVRWSHPLRGMVHPQQFLPLAAATGIDLKIAELVLRQACTQALAWSAEVGRPISVNVNIGERQLLDLRLVALIREVLAQVGLPAQQLELDVSEDLLLRKGVGTAEVLSQLESIGVRISLDDFGASSGSLQQLASAKSVSTVKIDREFVSAVAHDDVARNVIAAVVSLAQRCSIEVIAEGVETAEQVEVLHDLNVRQLQGFLFHRPGPAETVSAHLQPAAPADSLSLGR